MLTDEAVPIEKDIGGRPVEWTPERKAEAVDTICSRISEGQSLKSLLSNDDSLPSYSSFMTWINNDKGFLDKYCSAVDVRTEIRAEEITEIADEPPVTYKDANGETRIDPAFVALQKNRMDARKWEASKLKPKKFGDRVALDHAGSLTLTHEQQLQALDEDDTPREGTTSPPER